ncbi:tryptophan halogenase [Hephaestia caeni]|uniref:Tryptophan halogenase n=1 Tax=Hephaestia caeni TaxID=645617 RepID=A0A397NR86_9SPHN|nr:tryptophan halogenase family protein [Hephaestia caeni]RIA37697.1 tryptophan halogenase [Hephaestia caeni]
MTERATRVVILGGGTAGWMTAAAIARLLPQVELRLIESADIGIVGVGEATLPHLRAFVETLGIDEAEFMRTTSATYKLGIAFEGFGRIGATYTHPFGGFGSDLAGVGFHHYWRRMHAAGRARDIGAYSYPVVLAAARKFARPTPDGDPITSTYGYAYQFDATRFAPYLRDYAIARGAVRTEGKVVRVEQHPETGDVTALHLESGEAVTGDLFIDCSGFRSLLLGDTLKTPWEDWSHWLPCDRAAALPCESPEGDIEPLTRAIAMPFGWRWRIPLQHRVGNGYVYSSAHLSDDDACAAIVGAVEGKPIASPRVLRFRAGRRRLGWVKNVVAIGLSSGFLEPLESTSLYLAQAAITQLIELFPEDGRSTDADRDEFNRVIDLEHDRIRDFLILHYHATTRDDSDFWNHVRTMRVPYSLHEKIAMFRASGRVARYTKGLFLEPSWVAVYLGQGIIPERWDQRADLADEAQLDRALAGLDRALGAAAARTPGHREALAAHHAGAPA